MIYLHNLTDGQTGKIQVYKPYGLTPKEIVDIVLEKTGAKKGSFSGRLDPMACGIINIYLNESCLTAKPDDKLNKKYRFKMGIGIHSNTNDLLGIPTVVQNDEIIIYKIEKSIQKYLEKLKTTDYIQKQPIHSSYVVRNSDNIKNPLWWWAKLNRINEIQVPSFLRQLFDYKLLSSEYNSISSIARLAIERISLIHLKHDFNQLEIIEHWKKQLNNMDEISIVEMEITVSSGFYVRQLVEDIGKELGLKTITIEIERLSYISNNIS
jgi:tRNA U55 pseudouridine synthase TruB